MQAPTHRCRFVEYVPAAIRQLVFSPETYLKSTYLACARADGDIELWRLREGGARWHLERTIPGGNDASAEAMAWSHQIQPDPAELEDLDAAEIEAHKKALLDAPPRFFSAGEDAVITEWDTTTLQPVNTVDSNGGAVLCMKVSPTQTQLAVGCADGSIRLFSISEPGTLEYYKTLDKTDNTRTLSLAYDSTGNVLAAGGADSCIRRYDVNTGRCTLRMTMDVTADEQTMVWEVLILKNGTIVSADSNGCVQFREGMHGTLSQSFKSHAGDVLCLATNAKGTAVFSGSVDRKIVRYVPIGNEWTVSGEKRYHSHDVHTIALRTAKPFDILVSGGLDTSLIVLSNLAAFPIVNIQRMPHFPPRPIIYLCKANRWVAAMMKDVVRVWSLGSATQSMPAFETTKLPLEETSKLLLDVKLRVSSNLVSTAIAPNGKWIAVSDKTTTKLLSIRQDTSGKFSLRKASTSAPLPASYSIAFTPDSSRLIMSGYDMRLRMYEYVAESHGWESTETFEPQPSADLAPFIVVSNDGQWCAVGELSGFVHIYQLDSLKLVWTLPKLSSSPTALAFHPTSPTLVVTTSTNDIRMYNVERQRVSDWTREYSQRLPSKFKNHPGVVSGIAFGIRTKDRLTEPLVFWGARFVCVVDVDQPIPDEKTKQARIMQSTPATNGHSGKRKMTNGIHKSSSASFKHAKDKNGAMEDVEDNIEEEEKEEDANNHSPHNHTSNGNPSSSSSHHGRNGYIPIPSPPTSPSKPAHQHVEPPVNDNFRMNLGFAPIMYLDFLETAVTSTSSVTVDGQGDVVMNGSQQQEQGGVKEMVLVERPEIEVMSKLPGAQRRIRYGM
ncbi:hypothetical protein SmJEL517_g05677 [Synchytrium microbalum]|uniref:Uncharacterized protein n=1 Tax=Synchytrium microbalum TaxID=1806994 RepID=A0A507BK12_9FUNG|nr:uncharacterized protein SmJEL517_g05677 [Synchytrium microbalum]TPX30870.1 hypothetical protein SmJEL517_g05677 [Synchytrium microbalum]